MGRDKQDKADKRARRARRKDKETLEPQAPPRVLPPLRNPPLPDVPIAAPPPPVTSYGNSASQQVDNREQMALDGMEDGARAHISGQELDATGPTARKRARSPDSVCDQHTQKRAKKLTKIIAKMHHDIHSDRVTHDIDNLRMAARLVSRVIHPFISSHDALVFGAKYAQDNPDAASDDSDSDDDDDDDEDQDEDVAKAAKKAREDARLQKREYLYQFHALLDIMPDLKTDLDILDEDQMITYSDFIDHFAKASRGDDTNSLRKDILVLYRVDGLKPHEDFSNAPSSLAKHLRGWNNDYTARLLCPQECLSTFDDEPESFRARVLAGDIKITPGDYASLLYDLDRDNDLPFQGNEQVGLLKSAFLAACYKRLWTGRSSSFLPGVCAGVVVGMQPIARKYKVGRVSPRSIAYVAILARFCLSSAPHFKVFDDVGKFSNLELYTRIVNLFNDVDSPWCKETLAWWDMQIYGVAPAVPIKGKGHQEVSAADRLELRQKAEKKARKLASALARVGAPAQVQPNPGSDASGSS